MSKDFHGFLDSSNIPKIHTSACKQCHFWDVFRNLRSRISWSNLLFLVMLCHYIGWTTPPVTQLLEVTIPHEVQLVCQGFENFRDNHHVDLQLSLSNHIPWCSMGGASDISSFCYLDANFPTSEPSHCGADEVYRTSASVASTAQLSSMAPVTWLSVTIGSTAEFQALDSPGPQDFWGQKMSKSSQWHDLMKNSHTQTGHKHIQFYILPW